MKEYIVKLEMTVGAESEEEARQKLIDILDDRNFSDNDVTAKRKRGRKL